MKTQLMAEKLIHLEVVLLEQQEMLRNQRAEMTSLREALAQKKANRSIPTVTATPISPTPVQLKTPDTSRRKMLKRMGVAVLAGGAALGVTAVTYSPAEAKISVNPTAKVGAVITRNGAAVINIPPSTNYGLIASADDSLDVNSSLPSGNVGVVGNSSSGSGVQGVSSASGNGVYGYSHSGNGVYGYTTSGFGVYGNSSSSYGVFGYSSDLVGVYGEASNATLPAVVAYNDAAPSGIALQIQQGGLSVFGAGLGTATAVFIHRTTSGVSGNTSGSLTKINNELCNSRPDALLFVTPNATPNGTTAIVENKGVGVIYNSGFWYIYHLDSSPIQDELYFNVLIINPA